MAHHHRSHVHAPRYSGDSARRWTAGEAQHTVDQPSVAEQAKLLIQLEMRPEEFKASLRQWRARNGDVRMELGSPSTMPDVNFSALNAEDIASVSFAGITFRNATISSDAAREALVASGANLDRCTVGESEERITYVQPKPVPAPGPLSQRAQADKEAAAIRAMMNGGGHQK